MNNSRNSMSEIKVRWVQPKGYDGHSYALLPDEEKWGLLASLSIYPPNDRTNPLEAWVLAMMEENNCSREDIQETIGKSNEPRLFGFIWTLA